MQHRIPTDQLGPRAEAMAEAVKACVHCGFCLPTCPTYLTLGEEMDSPRGRIVLMKGVLEGELDLDESLPYVDRCLGCLSCVTACPSGVEYGGLLSSFRDHVEPRRRRRLGERLIRRLLLATLSRPRLLRLAGRLAPLGRPLRPVLPASLSTALDLLPRRLPASRPLPAVLPARGQRRARVALLAGCAQQVLDPAIGDAAARVLARNGVEVLVPEGQGCCGALALHVGDGPLARAQARRNLRVLPADVDAVVTTAAGCGSGMAEYPLLFAGEADQEAASDLASRARDVAGFLVELGFEPPPSLAEPTAVAYHDACHLAHAQGEREAPRALLRAIGGVQLREPRDWQICCGSAGLYNVEQPQVASQLGERKARDLLATGAAVVAAGNIGCLVQVRQHLAALGRPLPVLHTIEVLDRAYAGRSLAR